MRRAIDKANGKLVVLVIFAGSHFSVAFSHICERGQSAVPVLQSVPTRVKAIVSGHL